MKAIDLFCVSGRIIQAGVISLPGCGLGDHCLAAAWRTMEQDTLGGRHQRRVGKEAPLLYRQDDRLAQLPHQLLQSGNVTEEAFLIRIIIADQRADNPDNKYFTPADDEMAKLF